MKHGLAEQLNLEFAGDHIFSTVVCTMNQSVGLRKHKSRPPRQELPTRTTNVDGFDLVFNSFWPKNFAQTRRGATYMQPYSNTSSLTAGRILWLAQTSEIKGVWKPSSAPLTSLYAGKTL